MEVLFVSHKFPPSTGGMENQCYQLVTGMERKCKIHRLIFESRGSKLLFFLTLSRKIKKICKEHPEINIIHFNDALIACFCSFMKLPERVSCVATLHGLDVVFPSKIYHKYILSRLNFYSCMIAVSNATAKKAVSLGIKPEKIVVISNGVDITPSRDISTEAFQNWLFAKQIDLVGRKILMMMGRPVRRKGFTWFAEQVLPLLQDRFYLVIVGPFHQRATLFEKIIYSLPKGFRKKIILLIGYFSDERQLRKVINNTTNIKHLGRLPYSEIEMLLSKTDAFLMPNIPVDGDMEGFGLVCLEASAHGSLVFAANIDGISDAIMDGKNGYLLSSEDSHAWVDKLIEFSLNPDSFHQYKPVFSQYTIDNYAWTKMVCNYHMVFINLSDSHR